MREDLAANAAILRRLAEIDKTLLLHDSALREILQKLRPLLEPPAASTEARNRLPRQRRGRTLSHETQSPRLVTRPVLFQHFSFQHFSVSAFQLFPRSRLWTLDLGPWTWPAPIQHFSFHRFSFSPERSPRKQR